VKIELALVLAEATGRRLGAIRQLQWDHVNFEAAEITWVADFDKKGVEWVTPVPARLLDELRVFRKMLGAIGGSIFAGERKPGQAMDRHLFDKWLVGAEREAKLQKLPGGLWHPYRRKWAMERKHLPLTDVAAVGGWKDVGTLLSCYSQPDRQTMLDVMGETAKLRDVTPASGGKVPALSRDTQLEVMAGAR
jgi:integrase